MNDELKQILRDGGLTGPDAIFTPFGGGVSSDVWRVDDAGRSFVVKRSVPKLRVKADWFSDPARLRYEFLYLQTVAGIVPEAVPHLLGTDPDAPFIAMEFLGSDFSNWKARLLGGEIAVDDARRAGGILGRIHAATTKDSAVQTRFDTMKFFTELRIDAYLRATADAHCAAVAGPIREEADRLSSHHECLVHGDFSPKNMLCSPARFVVLDCETACFGDPAFDLAFVLNHLFLKALYHSARHSRECAIPALKESIDALRDAYALEQGGCVKDVEFRTARLLPMLLLARVDGKSPVEYLDSPQQEHIRGFASARIPEKPESLTNLAAAWFESL